MMLQSREDLNLTFAVVTTHLTFAHTRFATKHRAAQMITTMEEVDDIVGPEQRNQRKVIPVVVAGDFNGEEDVVTKYLSTLGYKDVLDITGEHCITHVDHNNRALCADHIFVSDFCDVENSVVLPTTVPPNIWFPRPVVGGDLSIFSNVSDHRAIMCDLVL
jgi:endonuclease/exonuclease/phosphatase family metal-dependent hydrolase